MYSLIIPKDINKQLDKLGNQIKSRILAKLILLKDSPKSKSQPLVGTKFWKTRIGDYRVVFYISDKKLVILVLEVEHRKKVYDRVNNLKIPEEYADLKE